MPSVIIWRCVCGKRYRARTEEGADTAKRTVRCPYCSHEEPRVFSGAIVEIQDETGSWAALPPMDADSAGRG